MKAIVIFTAIILVLYFMKVISFDFDLLKKRISQFKNWCIKLCTNLKNKFDSFIDFFNKKTGFVILILMVIALFSLYKKERVERKRFETNQEVLLKDVRYYKSKDSLNAASVGKMTVAIKELKESNMGLENTVSDLNLKLRRVESISQTGTETKYEVKTIIKDSLVYIEGKPVTLKCVDFKNDWLTVTGCENNGVFDGFIESRDTLIHIAHRVPRKFLFIKYGTKGINLDVVSKNPYTKISYLKYIELKK